MRITLILITLFVLIISCSTDDETKKDIDVSIVASSETILINETSTLSVIISNVKEMFAVSGEIHYDQSKIDIVNDSSQAGDIWNEESLIFNIDQENEFHFNVGNTYPAEEVSGSGTLFLFEMKGVSQGESNIELRNIKIIDKNGNKIPNHNNIEIYNTSITVN